MKKLVSFAFVAFLLVSVLGIFSSVSAGSTLNKVVYGYGAMDETSLAKYRADCASRSGTFNECGSFCSDGEDCIKACAYTCEGIPLVKKSDVSYKMRSEKGKIEVEYLGGTAGSEKEYTLKYEEGDESTFQSDLKIKGVSEDKIKVELTHGKEKEVSVLPEDAVKKVFGDEALLDKTVKLEEKVYKNVPRVVYNIDGKHEGKFLGLFKIAARYQGSVDATTGDVLEWDGPWWAFLITGEPDKPIVKGVNEVEVEEESEVFDFNSCFKKTGISTDGIPSECTYQGRTYAEGKPGYKGGDEDVSDYDSCVAAGNLIQETAPPRCMDKNGKTYVQGAGVAFVTIKKTISSFESCMKAGNPVMESYPRQCMTSEGVVFVEMSNSIIPGDSTKNLGAEGVVFSGQTFTGFSGQEVSIGSVSSDKVKLVVKPANTQSKSLVEDTGFLSEGDTYTSRLGTGFSFLVKDIVYAPGASKVVLVRIITDYSSCLASGVKIEKTDKYPFTCKANGITYKRAEFSDSILLPEVKDYVTCVAAGNIIRDEDLKCVTSEGVVYMRDLSSLRPTIGWDYDSCVENGGVIGEFTPQCEIPPCTMVSTCTIREKTYRR